MKKGILYLVMVAALVVGMVLPMAAPVMANGSTASSLVMLLSVSPSTTNSTGTLRYTVTLINLPLTGANPAQVDVIFYPPGPTGAKEAYGPEVVLDTDRMIAVNETVTYNWDGSGGAEARPALAVDLGAIPLNEGVSVVYAASEFDGHYIHTTTYEAKGDKNIPATVIWPNTKVTIGASPTTVVSGASTNLTVTEENTGYDELTNPYVEVWKNGVLLTTLNATTPGWSSNINADVLLDAGETWSWTITDIEITANTTFMALGFGTDLLGNEVSFATGYTGERDEVTVTVQALSALGDFVWHDENVDGTQDPEEEGIAGVTVKLYACNGTFLASTTTDEDGYYLFDNLMPGDYKVKFILLDDYYFSPQYAGNNTAVDSNADPDTGFSECVTLAPGETNLTIDAGMYQPVKPFEALTVEKTAVTSYNRTHEWDIDKWVETEYGHTIGEEEYPKIWLYDNGSGDETATWSVNVTYEGYEDSGFNVSGNITITNTGEVAVNITGIEDRLGGTLIDVDWKDDDGNPVASFPYILEAGFNLTANYSEDGYVEGLNVVTVTTEEDEYPAEAAIVWGDPTTEANKTVTIKDISDIFGEVELGTVTAPNGATFTYDKDFAWTDYSAPGPYTYNNTATIVETGQSASAILKVNWVEEELCWGDETAWAYGGEHANPNWDYVNNRFWGWTNGPLPEGNYEFDLYAGAGLNDLSKGTKVGTVSVNYTGGCVTVTYQTDPGYYIGETHLWVGDDVLPEVRRGLFRWVYTNAPGQFPYGVDYGFDPEDPSTWETSWTWSQCDFEGEIYVAAHAVVWMQVECPEDTDNSGSTDSSPTEGEDDSDNEAPEEPPWKWINISPPFERSNRR